VPKKKIRVLALVPDAFGGHGGIALYLNDLLQATAELEEIEEILVIARNPIPVGAALPAKVKVCDVSGGKSGMFKALSRLFLDHRNFDLVICGHINFLPLAALAQVLTQAKMLMMIYGIDAWKPIDGFLQKYLLRRAFTIASISEHTRALFCGWSGKTVEQIAILPNAIHAERYGLAAPDAALQQRYGVSSKRVLLTLGRLSALERYKGIDEILNVLPELLAEIPDLVYVVAGDGDDRERLQALAHTLGVDEHVRFIGRISEHEKAAHFQMAEAFAMPGRGEGFGFVFLEAMACGIPVVASTLDGSREAVRDGALGLLVNPDNRGELMSALRQALNQPKAIPDGLEFFAFSNFKSKLRGIYVDMELIAT